MAVSLLNPAPQWEHSLAADGSIAIEGLHEVVTLWHGCTSDDWANILNNQGHIQVIKGSASTDFGRGFYTTTIQRQARHWAWLRYFSKCSTPPPGPGGLFPCTLQFKVRREDLTAGSMNFKMLSFISGNYDSEGYWSLVQHCRSGGSNQKCVPTTCSEEEQWYDVVTGPAAAFWQQRVAMNDSDQISFHTQRICDTVLNPLIDSYVRNGQSRTNYFDVIPV